MSVTINANVIEAPKVVIAMIVLNTPWRKVISADVLPLSLLDFSVWEPGQPHCGHAPGCGWLLPAIFLSN